MTQPHTRAYLRVAAQNAQCNRCVEEKMGYEFKIAVSPWSPEKVEQILRSVPEFSGVEPEFGQLQFRSQASADPHSMPDAHAMVQEDHLYFCDNGGAGADILKRLIRSLESESEEVVSEEL